MTMPRPRPAFRTAWFSALAACSLGASLTAPCAVVAQDEPQFSIWAKVESSEDFRKFVDRLRKGEFDDASKAFLERVALPQLAVAGNRPRIEQVRRALRMKMLDAKVAADAGVFDKAATAAVEVLLGLSRNPQAEPPVRVNAMLLIGEIRGKDDRTWGGSLAPLAGATADAKLPVAVRVAAAAGLARHVEESAKATGAAEPAVAQVVTPPLLAVIAAAPVAADGAAGSWLVSRSLDMLRLIPKASPEAAAALMQLVGDGTRPLDVRVRAAAALGASATADSKLNAAAAVAAIRSLAAETLKADLATVTERAVTSGIGGQSMMQPMAFRGGEGAPPPMMRGGEFGGGIPGEPVGDDPVDDLIAKRDAWRLMMLANATASADGSTGLAALLAGEAKDRSLAVAATLREWATTLDGAPEMETLKQAVAAIEKLAPPDGGIAPAAASAPPG